MSSAGLVAFIFAECFCSCFFAKAADEAGPKNGEDEFGAGEGEGKKTSEN